MALDAAIVIELRSDGDIDNGGGFKAGASGTDRSQIRGVHLSVSDLACSDHAGPPFDVTSATGGFVSDMVGQYLEVQSSGDGGHFVTGVYEVTAFTDTNTISLVSDPTDGTDETGGQAELGGYMPHTDLACSDHTGPPFDVTSANSNFDAADVGNLIWIKASGNWTEGPYEITAQSGGNQISLDRDPTNGSDATAGTGYVGGAQVFQDLLFESLTPGNLCYVKAGTHTLTAAIAAAGDGTIPLPIVIEGYNSTRGDVPTGTDRPLIACGANTFEFDDYWIFKHLRITITTSNGWRADNGGTWINCEAENASGSSFRDAVSSGGTKCRLIGVEASSTNGEACTMGSDLFAYACYVHNSSSRGFFIGGSDRVTLDHCVVDTCGVGVDASTNVVRPIIKNCIFYNNTIGIESDANAGNEGWSIFNNIFQGNTDGIQSDDSGAVPQHWYVDHNCYYNNTRDHSWDNGSSEDNSFKGANAVNADPLLNDPANGDFTLQSGSPCIGAGAHIGNSGITGIYNNVNIGVDQDDNAAAGGGTTNLLTGKL